jgi:hypothetical protein
VLVLPDGTTPKGAAVIGGGTPPGRVLVLPDGTSPNGPVVPLSSGNPDANEYEIKMEAIGNVSPDGEVEVSLALREKANPHKDIEIQNAQWRLDEQPLMDPTKNQWLQRGKHTVTVKGKTKEGKAINVTAVPNVIIPKPVVEINSTPPE